MKKLRYLVQIAAYIFIISALVISGCKSKKSGTTDSNTVKTGKTTNPITGERRPLDKIVSLADPNEVAATINGTDIKEGEIQKIIAPEIDRIKEAPGASALPEETISTYVQQIRQDVLQQLIIENLLDQKVKDANIVVTSAEAEEVLKKQLAENSVSMEDFKKTLETRKADYNQLLNDIKKDQSYRKLVDAQLEGKINITEEQAKKFYDENPKAFDVPEQVRASHILVICDSNEPNDVKQKAKTKIEDLLRQVKEGADFAALAKANSDDKGSAVQGGDLDYFTKGQMVEPFETAAFKLETGKVSDVVETDYGYHIIKVTDHKKAETKSFDDTKKDIIELLTNRQKSDYVNTYVETLLKDAKITFPKGKEIKLSITEQQNK
jgi:peptidyl-prolyl cis-trans isomerase C